MLCRNRQVSGLLEQLPKLRLGSETHGSICVQEGEPNLRRAVGNTSGGLGPVSGLRPWFDAESERTGRELFERLRAEYPGVYPEGQQRILQRRLDGWRRMVFVTPTEGLASRSTCPMKVSRRKVPPPRFRAAH